MNATLTDRYIDAATRSIPEKQRPDIAAELQERISDEIDGRLAAGDTPDAAERAVLTELGDPDKLAAEYLDRPLYVIGPRYYLTWWRLLKLLWAIVPVCAAFGVSLGLVIDGQSFGKILGTVIPVVIQTIVNIGFWTTLVFFVIERTTKSADIGLVGEWTLDRLPERRTKGAGFGDLITALILLAAIAGAVLWDHFIGFVYLGREGGWMPFLSADLWPWWIGGLFALLVLEALLALAVYLRGRWDMMLATVNLVLNIAITVPALWLLGRQQLLNQDFFPAIIPESAETVTTVLAALFGFGIAAVAIWDSIDGYLKARRAAV